MKRILSILILIAGTASATQWFLLVDAVPSQLGHAMEDTTFQSLTNCWLNGAWQGNQLFDFSLNRSNAMVVSPCATFDGTDYLTVTGITTANVVTCSGTATPTAGTNRIDFTSGTAWDITIDGELVYPAQEKARTKLYSVSTNWGNATATLNSLEATFWGGTQTNSHWFAEHGGSRAFCFNGSSSVIAIPSDQAVTNFNLTASILFGDVGVNATIYDLRDGFEDGIQIRIINTGSVQCYVNNAFVSFPASGLDDGEFHDLLASWDGSTITLAVADHATNTTSYTGTVNVARTTAYVGDNFSSVQPFNGSIKTITLTGNGNAFDFDASKNYGSTIVDFSGNGNNGTSTDIGGLCIPAMASGLTDALGDSISNPPNYAHNGGPQGIIIGGVTNYFSTFSTNWTGKVEDADGFMKEVWQ